MNIKNLASILALACICSGAEPAEKNAKPETKQSAKAAFQKADKELNEVWAKLKSESLPSVFRELQEDQRGWIEHRDYIATGIGTVPGGTDPAKAKDTMEYLAMAAGLMEERTEYLRAKLKDPGPEDSIDGVWRDSVGGTLTVAEQGAKLYFECSVVRGPTFHSGDITGVAKWNAPLGFFTDAESAKDEPDKKETWLIFRHDGPTLALEGANTSYYHGARAFFDGKYTRTKALPPAEKTKLIEAAKKGIFRSEEPPQQ